MKKAVTFKTLKMRITGISISLSFLEKSTFDLSQIVTSEGIHYHWRGAAQKTMHGIFFKLHFLDKRMKNKTFLCFTFLRKIFKMNILIKLYSSFIHTFSTAFYLPIKVAFKLPSRLSELEMGININFRIIDWNI